MVTRNYSSEALLAFLREAALAGLMTPAVARSRRAAAEALFSKLTDAEAADLRELRVDALMARFLDIHGHGLRSEVVQLYGERLHDAIDDYFRFIDDPGGFRSRVPRTQLATARAEAAPETAETRALERVRLGSPTQRPDVLPVPLGGDRVVYLHGIPADLTAREARKLCRVITALSDDDQEAVD